MNDNLKLLEDNICPNCKEQGTLVIEMVGLAYVRLKNQRFEIYEFDKNDFEKVGDVYCNCCGVHFDYEGNMIKED